jgi:RNA polymerase sigma-70 factor (ECF subfamily)
MSSDASDISGLLERAAANDEQAFRELFTRYRDRLKRMVHLRLSRRLQGRVDDSDIVQEACLEASRRLQEYVADPGLPFYLLAASSDRPEAGRDSPPKPADV